MRRLRVVDKSRHRSLEAAVSARLGEGRREVGIHSKGIKHASSSIGRRCNSVATLVRMCTAQQSSLTSGKCGD